MKKAVNWALRNIGKRNKDLRAHAIASAQRIQHQGSRPARWIAADALRELSPKAKPLPSAGRSLTRYAGGPTEQKAKLPRYKSLFGTNAPHFKTLRRHRMRAGNGALPNVEGNRPTTEPVSPSRYLPTSSEHLARTHLLSRVTVAVWRPPRWHEKTTQHSTQATGLGQVAG